MLTPVEEAFVPLRPAVSALPAYVPGARAGSSAPAWKLSSNENPYAPLPSVQAAITRAAAEVNRYPDMYAEELVGALAAHSGVAAENVVVGNGSVALLSHILNAVVDHGDEIVFPWRSFEAYPIAAAVSGGKAVTVPLEEGTGRLDLPAMAAAVTPRTRVVFVCSPNNPTGPAVHAGELETFLAAVPKNVLVVLDEAYLEFVRDPEAPDGIDVFTRHANVLLLRTLSKAHGLAGLRVGYAIAEPRLAAGIRAVSTPFGVSHRRAGRRPGFAGADGAEPAAWPRSRHWSASAPASSRACAARAGCSRRRTPTSCGSTWASGRWSAPPRRRQRASWCARSPATGSA